MVRQRLIVVMVSLALWGCASSITKQRNAPDLSFQGPLRSASVTASQVKLAQQGIAASFKDGKTATFGKSYKAGISANNETIVCGYVNGKKFAGMFAKPSDGPMEFLPIGVSINQEEEDAVKTYCRSDGIYLPR